MKKIAVLSDTHGLLRPEVLEILRGCDAILHGGDISRQKILDALNGVAPVFAVRGNNDKEWAENLPETLHFTLFGIRFFMVHNKKQIPENLGDVDIVVYGHSHKYEEKYVDGRLFLNPGSCGPRRFTQPVTLAVLEVEEDREAGSRDEAEAGGKAGSRTAAEADRHTETDSDRHAGTGSGTERTPGVFWRVKKIEIAQKTFGSAKNEEAEPGNLPENIRQVIVSIMKDTDKGKSVQEIAAKHGVSEALAEQICRLYLTHPGVDADGIMGKMGI